MRNTQHADQGKQLIASALETLLNVVSSEKRSETAFQELLVQVQYSQVELEDQHPTHWLHLSEAAGRARKVVQDAEERGEPDYAMESLVRIAHIVFRADAFFAPKEMQESYQAALAFALRAKEVAEMEAE